MFSTNYKVRIDDINYGGHMGNERALVIFQQTRMDWLNSLGFDEINIGDGKGTIQLESHVYYLKEVVLGEELLCYVKEVEFGKSYFDIFYEVKNQSDEIVLKGSTRMMAFDYERKRVGRIPKVFKEKIDKI
ncbi:acyl-CoA thioesterase [Fusobacterium sp. MFO224]|uniref:acyl-CoA thioesterase n=1 Tax=Fusobacterium sp. MFO224 TaxID=3378070 RepID=UPI00385249A6